MNDFNIKSEPFWKLERVENVILAPAYFLSAIALGGRSNLAIWAVYMVVSVILIRQFYLLLMFKLLPQVSNVKKAIFLFTSPFLVPVLILLNDKYLLYSY